MKVCFLILITFQIFFFSLSEDRLVFLYAHYRHGARAPLAINDSFYDRFGEYWDNPGELTGVGQRMLYILGLKNREKYIKQEKFLSEKFDPHEIYIYSTNYNRTMESGSSYLQGLYPISEHLGYTLTEEQKELAYPPGNISEDVQKAVNDLDVAALPYKMTLAPVRVIGDNDGEINVYAFDSCIEKMNEIRQQNNEISQLKDYIKNFNEKYAVNWNKYFNKETAEFDFNEISSICDAFLSNYVEKKR